MRFLKQLVLLCSLAAACFLAWIGWFAFTPLTLKSETLEFTIPSGIGLRQTAHLLKDAGAGFAPWQFVLLGRLMGRAGDIKAGSYEIEAGTTPFQLLAKLAHGDVSMGEIVFVEGKTFADGRAAMAAHPHLKHDSDSLGEAEILRRLGAAETHAEGLLFPDTYWFAKNGSDMVLLRHSYRLMQSRLQTEWDRRDASLPYRTPYEALIMASIVEKETGQATDRAAVAEVFVNRLNRGMALQTDPTVIYGLGAGFDGNLRKRDLTTDTSYNTYTRRGLPPTPIAMPSLASLQAALHPAKGDLLYFVSRGDGSSQFSRTLDEHNRAVARYQLHRGG
jgi:UPF0755 protein